MNKTTATHTHTHNNEGTLAATHATHISAWNFEQSWSESLQRPFYIENHEIAPLTVKQQTIMMTDGHMQWIGAIEYFLNAVLFQFSWFLGCLAVSICHKISRRTTHAFILWEALDFGVFCKKREKMEHLHPRRKL